MREICTSGSEGGAGQANAPFLPLSERRPVGEGGTVAVLSDRLFLRGAGAGNGLESCAFTCNQIGAQ